MIRNARHASSRASTPRRSTALRSACSVRPSRRACRRCRARAQRIPNACNVRAARIFSTELWTRARPARRFLTARVRLPATVQTSPCARAAQLATSSRPTARPAFHAAASTAARRRRRAPARRLRSARSVLREDTFRTGCRTRVRFARPCRTAPRTSRVRTRRTRSAPSALAVITWITAVRRRLARRARPFPTALRPSAARPRRLRSARPARAVSG